MNEVNVYLDNQHSVGLGDNICMLSALANVPDRVNLYTTNDHNTFARLNTLIDILQIPKTSVNLVLSNEQGNFSNHGWPLKLLTDYHKPKAVKVNNQLLDTKFNIEKKCVAIAGFYDNPLDDQNCESYQRNQWPWCKHRPIEYWAKIFSWLKSMNYDVITVDKFWSLENKVDTLVRNCCAIISYEGGMAHLAHTLQLPCFLIDWKHPSPSTKLGTFHCDLVHKTNTVHIVRNDNEFFNWNYDQFQHRIHELSQGMTNNRILNKDYSIRFEESTITSPFEILDNQGHGHLYIKKFSSKNPLSDFLDRYYSVHNNLYLNS
jgi:hypothetical protein